MQPTGRENVVESRNSPSSSLRCAKKKKLEYTVLNLTDPNNEVCAVEMEM